MPRSIRLEFAGAMYHVMAHGNRREAIFLDDEARRFFLKAVGEACGMTGWRVHAWVLMSNHYHLLLESPPANLVDGRQWLQNTRERSAQGRPGAPTAPQRSPKEGRHSCRPRGESRARGRALTGAVAKRVFDLQAAHQHEARSRERHGDHDARQAREQTEQKLR